MDVNGVVVAPFGPIFNQNEATAHRNIFGPLFDAKNAKQLFSVFGSLKAVKTVIF